MSSELFSLSRQLPLVEKRRTKEFLFHGPVKTDNGLYYGLPFDDQLLLVDTKRWSVSWRASTAIADTFEFRPEYCLSGLLVGAAGCGVAAFDSADGAMAWLRPDRVGIWWRNDKLVSTADYESRLVQLDPSTGADVGDLLRAECDMSIFNGAGQEVVLCSRSQVGDAAGPGATTALYRCIAVDGGTLLWEKSIAAELATTLGERVPKAVAYLIPGSLGTCWIGRYGDRVFACDRKDGSLLWLAKHQCGSVASVRSGRVFGMDEGGRFHVLDERTGELIARHDGTGLEDVMFPRPAAMLDDYAVYGTESGHVIVFDPKDARVVWRKRHKVGTPNVGVVDGQVYVTTVKGELLVYQPE